MRSDSPDGYPPKSSVVGIPISMTSYDEVLALIDRGPVATDRAAVVAICTVHSVMTARRDPAVRAAISAADVATSDGMPLVWTLRWTAANPDQQRVYGPDLLEHALTYGLPRGWRHFFYGASEDTLDALVAGARRTAPGIDIVGRISPPFRPLTEAELDAHVAAIGATRPTVVWVGLGMPKQEQWMAAVADRLAGTTLVGVGAAFAMHAGELRQAPDWLQRIGMEWLFRLAVEPRRLWRRYLSTNPAFLVALAWQLFNQRVLHR